MPPEKTSWKISRKGMSVMAAVVLRARLDIHRASTSAAKETKNMVMPISTIIQGVNIPLAGNWTPTARQIYMVRPVCSRQRSA